MWDPKGMCISSTPIDEALRLVACQMRAQARFCFQSVSALEKKKNLKFPVSVPDMHIYGQPHLSQERTGIVSSSNVSPNIVFTDQWK